MLFLGCCGCFIASFGGLTLSFCGLLACCGRVPSGFGKVSDFLLVGFDANLPVFKSVLVGLQLVKIVLVNSRCLSTNIHQRLLRLAHGFVVSCEAITAATGAGATCWVGASTAAFQGHHVRFSGNQVTNQGLGLVDCALQKQVVWTLGELALKPRKLSLSVCDLAIHGVGGVCHQHEEVREVFSLRQAVNLSGSLIHGARQVLHTTS